MRLAIIGDVHANAEALAAAFRETDRLGYDLRVLMGDLLTYGVDVAKTLDLVSDAIAAGRTVLIMGNHDELYSQLIGGRRDLVPPLPEWVEAHVGWTLPAIPTYDWLALPFQSFLIVEGIYISHANPFGPQDWRYLNRLETNTEAARVLRDRQISCGIFGHTHRARWFSMKNDRQGGDFRPFGFGERRLVADWTHILNAGSVGQPRSAHPREVVLWLEIRRTAIVHRYQPLTYDLETHRRGLLDSSLPESVKTRCLEFHRDATRDRGWQVGRIDPRPLDGS